MCEHAMTHGRNTVSTKSKLVSLNDVAILLPEKDALLPATPALMKPPLLGTVASSWLYDSPGTTMLLTKKHPMSSVVCT